MRTPKIELRKMMRYFSGLADCWKQPTSPNHHRRHAPMAAPIFLPQDRVSRKSPIGRRGVLTLTGFGIKIRMQAGHLELEDGIGLDRRKMRIARVRHGLKRVVCI